MTKNVRDRRRPAETTQQTPDVSVEPKPVTETSDHNREEIDEEDVDERDTEEAIAEVDCGASLAAQPGAEALPDCTPEEARLRLALYMIYQGRTQKEIAKHFKVDPRTIWNWKQKMRGMTLGVIQNLNPQREFERAYVSIGALEMRLRRVSADAEARRDFDLVIRCTKELARLAEQSLRLLSRHGAFDHLDLAQMNGDDTGQRQTDLLSDMFEALHADVADLPSKLSSEDD